MLDYGGNVLRAARHPIPARMDGPVPLRGVLPGEIRWIDPAAPERSGTFGTTLAAGPVDVQVGRDGDLYYLARGNANPTGGPGTAMGLVVRVGVAEGQTGK